MDQVKAVWLTVNRICQFRCLWCYAEDTRYSSADDMSLWTAQRLIEIAKGVGIKNFILLGGEPALWPHLHTICPMLEEPTIVSNGLAYANKKRAAEDLATGANISISLKAGNAVQYKELAKADVFDKVMLAFRNLVDLGHAPNVGITISSLVAHNIDEMVKVSFENGARSVTMELCSPVFQNGQPQIGYMLHPRAAADLIVSLSCLFEAYPNLILSHSLPFCLFPDGFLDNLKQRDQLISGCHVAQRSGIVFSPKGELLLCNVLHDFELGRLDIDFHYAHSFKEFWHRKEVVEANEALACFPHRACSECGTYDSCCGGCALQWMVFDPQLIGDAKCSQPVKGVSVTTVLNRRETGCVSSE